MFLLLQVVALVVGSSSSSSRGSGSSSHHHVTLWNSGTCPYAQRAWIALLEKGIDFDFQTVDLQNKDATPEFGIAYYKANPNTMCSSKVPLLIVKTAATGETKYYTESKVVLEVIEELSPQHGSRLLSDDIDERYRARLFGDAVYDSIWGGDRSPYKMLGRKINNENNDWDQSKEEQNLCLSLEALDKSLQSLDSSGSNGPFVCGSHFTLAECITAPFVQRADFVLSEYLNMQVLEHCQRHGYKRAGTWWRAVLERPSVQQTATPDPRASVERMIDMMSKTSSSTTK